MNFFVLALVLLGNLWIWRIFAFSLILGLIVVVASIFLYLSSKKKSRKFPVFLLILFALILAFQWRATDVSSLTYLSNDEQRIQAMRLKEYPAKWLRVGHWFEERPESIAFFRILNNFYETADPNLYFFANHPRERVGVVELEKFPYVLLPFFLLGLLVSINGYYKNKLLFVSIAAPIILISALGHNNSLGPFSLFPFFAVVITNGIETSYKKLQKVPKPKAKLILVGSFFVFLLVFLQVIAYAWI